MDEGGRGTDEGGRRGNGRGKSLRKKGGRRGDGRGKSLQKREEFTEGPDVS